jgi:hypothetical protein
MAVPAINTAMTNPNAKALLRMIFPLSATIRIDISDQRISKHKLPTRINNYTDIS